MTSRKQEPSDLLTVQEAAHLLRLSDDSVRRQIKEGGLHAVRVRTTPTGRAQYRIPSQVISQILQGSAVDTPPAAQPAGDDPFAPLREAFVGLAQADQEELIGRAVTWARERRPADQQARLPALSEEEIRQRFAGSRLLDSDRT